MSPSMSAADLIVEGNISRPFSGNGHLEKRVQLLSAGFSATHSESLGHAANIHALMPFYMVVALALLKPLVTIWMLGPPAGVVQARQEPFLAVEAPTSNARHYIKDLAKREGPACAFIFLAVVGLAGIFLKTWRAMEAPNTFTEILMLWANASGVTSMVNIVGLLGLYAEEDEANAMDMLIGIGVRDSPLRVDGPVERRLQKFFGGDGLSSALLTPLQLALGGLWGSLNRDALSRVPSRGQQWLARGLWCCFKPAFQLLLLVALPGIVAYFWLFLGLVLGIGLGSVLSTKYALPAALSARRLLGSPREHIEAARQDVQREGMKWFFYMLAPTLVAVIAPIFVPLTLRLLSGEGYWASLIKTYEDRHATAFFDNLLIGVNHSFAAAWSKMEVVTALLGTIV